MNNPIIFLFELAILLSVSKIIGLLVRKIGLPQVLGYIIAGILIGPAIWELCGISSPLFPIVRADSNPYLKAFATVGVIFVMFSAGLETDLKQLKSVGLIAFLVAMGGVLLPLGAGFGLGAIFLPNEHWTTWLFIGVILTATSVGITVAVMKELGKLQTKVGTIVLSAAIIDDVLGIIVLSIAMSLSSNSSSLSPVLDVINPNGNIGITIAWMIVFFIVTIGGGIGIAKLFKYIEKRTPHTRRIPIFSIAVCMLYSFLAEYVFGIADITGAYVAGLVLSTVHNSAEYTDRKVTVSSYLIFGPIFFANIGISISFKGFTLDVLWFALAFVATGILMKIIGCGLVAKCARFSLKDSARIGVGMIARGEVALIVTQKGIEANLIDDKYIVITVLLVLISSILAPILLKLLYRGESTINPMLTKTEVEEGHFE